MHNITRNTIIVAGLIGLGVVGTLMNTGSNPGALHAASNVGVTVMSPIPLPVSGTVDVGTMPAVTLSGTPNVHVTNSPTVSLSGTPNVAVTNGTGSPVPIRDVDNPGRHPFTATCGMSAFAALITCFPTPSAPAGSVVVIQYINIDSSAATNPTTFLDSFQYVAGGNTNVLFLPNVALDASDAIVSQSVTLYVDPSSGFACISLASNISSGSITCTISGYTVAQ